MRTNQYSGDSVKSKYFNEFSDKIGQNEIVFHIISTSQINWQWGGKEKSKSGQGFVRIVLTSEKLLIKIPDGNEMSDIIIKYPQIEKCEIKDNNQLKISTNDREIFTRVKKPLDDELTRIVQVMEDGPPDQEIKQGKEEKQVSEDPSGRVREIKFRGVEFGVSKDEILSSESQKPIDNLKDGRIEVLEFSDSLKGEEVRARYRLVDGEFATGEYCSKKIFYVEKADDLFHSLEDLLREKYGEPSERRQTENEKVVRESGGFRGVINWRGEGCGISLRNRRFLGEGFYQVKIQYEDDRLMEKLQSAADSNTVNKL
ncbi:MAG: hypothetical protein ABEJ03_03930 [Candidatus Nanohaloarchaea archaeon]